MMSTRLQIILMIVMLLVVIYIVNLVRKKRIDFKYALMWLFVDICILLLTIVPDFLTILSKAIGIASPMNMLFFFGFCFAVIIIFFLSLSVSKLADKVRKLSQEIAIIRKDMHDNYVCLKYEKGE